MVDDANDWSEPGYDDETLEQWGMQSGIDVDDLSRTEFVDYLAEGSLSSDEVARAAASIETENEAEALVADLEAVGRDADEDGRIAVAACFAQLGHCYPDAIAEAAPLLVEFAGAASVSTQNYALAALADVAEKRPSVVREVVPHLQGALFSAYTGARQHAVEIAATLSEEHPGDIVPLVPGLMDALAPRQTEDASEIIAEQFAAETATLDGRDGPTTERVDDAVFPTSVAEQFKLEREATVGESVRHGLQQEQAALTISNVAASEPEVIVPHVEALIGVLSSDVTDPTRRSLLDAVYAVAERTPTELTSEIDAVAAQLAADSVTVRGSAARVLAVLGEHHPKCVASAVDEADPTLGELLDADPKWVRGAAVNLLSYVAEVAPERVHPLVDDIVDLLDDDALFVRGGAVWCLRYLDDDAVTAVLREAADSDPDERVRRMATEALAARG